MTRKYRWVILASGSVATAALSAVQQGLPALGPTLQERFGLTLSEVGLVFTALGVGIIITLLGWGLLADRYGERFVISAGLTVAAFALVGAAFTTTLGQLLVALTITGLFGSSAVAASGRAIVGWFGRKERALALGLRQTAVPLGGALAAAVLPLLAGGDAIKAPFLALAGLAFGAALVNGLFLREPPERPDPPVIEERPRPFRDRRLWRLAAGSALIICGQVAMVGFVALFLFDARGWSKDDAALALSGMLIGGAVARALAGRWSDLREDRIRPLRRLALAAAVALCALALLTHAPGWALMPVLAAAGILSMSWNGLSFTAAAEIAGRAQTGTAIGLQNTLMRVVGAALPTAFGALVGATSWGLAFGVLAAFPLAGFLVLHPLIGEEDERRARRERRLAERRREAASAPKAGDRRSVESGSEPRRHDRNQGT